MAKSGRKLKKVRVRKALSVREQAELARDKTQSSQKPSKASVARKKLPHFGVERTLGRVLAIILWPLRPLLRPLRWLVPSYFVNSWREVKQVTWPNRRETWRLTLAVFIFAVVFGLLIAGVDWVLDQIFKKVVLKQ